MSEGEEPGFERLLHYLQQQRGFDFGGYKRPSLMRRVERRMQMAGIEGFDNYVDYLEVHPEEFAQLFNTILINVTAFFRDEPAWDYLKAEVVPQLLKSKGAHEQLRVWSAGCASGQEAYTIAMVFAETMGAEEFRERVKIYGTDADEEALNQARVAAYTPKELDSVDPRLVQRYFEPIAGRQVFRPDLRRAVIFGRHDIVQDAPISRLDLLVCRNTLMYFNAETQARILQRFHFALNAKGHLFLGRAEMLISHGDFFTPVNLKCRVFAKVGQSGMGAAHPRQPADSNANSNGTDMPHDRLRDQALEESPVPRIVVDANGTLAVASQKARVLFTINPKDIGRPLQDLEISYRPLELRSLIEQAYAERRAVTQTSVERRFHGGEPQYFDVTVGALVVGAHKTHGVSVTIVDVCLV
jgi:two-component system CheB/CheR fusion protein